jgi:hypothetical protein
MPVVEPVTRTTFPVNVIHHSTAAGLTTRAKDTCMAREPKHDVLFESIKLGPRAAGRATLPTSGDPQANVEAE